jgi:hypothetical protein
VIPARLDAQLLSRPTGGGAVAVVDRLLAVQAQDPRGARLAIRRRSTGLTALDVEAELNAGTLVVSWLNRGTLHLVRAEDYWWLHALTTPQLRTANERRLQQTGVPPEQADRGVAAVTAAVAERPHTRHELRTVLDGADVPTAGQALVHVLFAAAIAGSVVRGPMVGTDQAYVSAPHWIGPPPDRRDRDEALARLARRYLAGHGPADARDLATWAGIPLGQARRGLESIDAELAHSDDGGVDLADRAPVAPPPAPMLLGAFDPLLLGWASRKPVVGPHAGLVTTNGIFRPFALVEGRAVGTWGLRGNLLTLTCLEPVSPEARAALEDDAEGVLRFLGLAGREPVIVT